MFTFQVLRQIAELEAENAESELKLDGLRAMGKGRAVVDKTEKKRVEKERDDAVQVGTRNLKSDLMVGCKGKY